MKIALSGDHRSSDGVRIPSIVFQVIVHLTSVEHSSDLGVTDAWTVVPVPDTSGTTGAVTFTVSGSGTLDVTATIDASEAADGKLFGRVSATE